MPRLLHHHDRLLTRTDRRRLRWLQHRALPADRRQSPLDGRLLVQAEVDYPVQGIGASDDGQGAGYRYGMLQGSGVWS